VKIVAGTRKPSKKRSSGRIDGMVALAMAIGAAPAAWTGQGGHSGVDRLSASCPLFPCPVEAGLAPLLRRLRRETSRPREHLLPRLKASPRILLRSILSPRSSKSRAVRSASFSCAASYLKSAIRPSPSLFSTCPTKADHGIRHFIEVGVDEVAPVFRVQLRSDARRADEIAEQGRERRRLGKMAVGARNLRELTLNCPI
jgi:hypothetical protein